MPCGARQRHARHDGLRSRQCGKYASSNSPHVSTSHRVRSKFTTAPLDNLPESHKLQGPNVHFDLPIPSGSPLQSHTFHKEADLEDLLGMTDRQKTRTSTAIVTQTDVIDLPNIKEMISNGA